MLARASFATALRTVPARPIARAAETLQPSAIFVALGWSLRLGRQLLAVFFLQPAGEACRRRRAAGGFGLAGEAPAQYCAQWILFRRILCCFLVLWVTDWGCLTPTTPRHEMLGSGQAEWAAARRLVKQACFHTAAFVRLEQGAWRVLCLCEGRRRCCSTARSNGCILTTDVGGQAPATQRLPRAVVEGQRNASVKQLRMRLAAVTSIQRTCPSHARSRARPGQFSDITRDLRAGPGPGTQA
jgi:hypothetical protein